MRIVAIFVAILIVLVILAINENKFSKKNKIIFLSIIFGVTILGYILSEILNSNSDDKIRESFLQGKNLKCENYDVNDTYFNYSFATSSFIAKPEFKEFSDIVIKTKSCKIDE